MFRNLLLLIGFILGIVFVGSTQGVVINGGWSHWSAWTHCTTGYSPNYRVRARECNDPEPSVSGQYCVGDQRETKDCLSNIWSAWSAYTSCSVTCGVGQQSRTRHCTTGNDCQGQTSDHQQCTQPQCVVPIDGAWGAWTQHGHCSETCGQGELVKVRQCNSPAPSHGGLDCVGVSYQFVPCSIRGCPIDGGWTNFTDLPCSTTCGHGVATSTRKCTNPAPANGGKNCTGLAYTFRPCQNVYCPIDGQWAGWGVWGSCSVTSGVGINIRTRTCTQPAPQYGGKDCGGDQTETTYCALNAWAEWSSWTHCDVTCGNGTQSRTRTCSTGNDCIGSPHEVSSCYDQTCPPAGVYSDWSSWGVCTASCGYGISTRTRTCNNTSGYPCSGAFMSRKDCKQRDCPIDGAYGPWTNWTECSVTCGSGLRFRKRECDSPAPTNGGKECPGDFLDVKNCTMAGCVVDGGWSLYVNHSCSATCGPGVMMGVRACTHPAPQNGGQDCQGPFTKQFSCNDQPCPIDGGWGGYTPLPCSVTCGTGQLVELRECDNPKPQYGGKYCVGLSHRFKDCHMPTCSVDGGWSDWSLFTQCKATCGDGFQVRTRSCNNPTPTGGGKNCSGYADERTACNNGPCPSDMPICNKTRVSKDLHDHTLYATVMPTPCSQMDYVSQERMLRNVCNAPIAINQWRPSKDIRQFCDSIPQYSPLTIFNRNSNTMEYGVVLDCYKEKLQYATETCERGVHEVNVDIAHDNTRDYFTTTW